MQLSSLRCSFSGPDPLKCDKMFVRRNDTSFDSFFLLFSFLAFQFLLFTMIDQCLIVFAINFGQSLKYNDRKKRVYVNACRKIYTTHDGELIIFLSHTHTLFFFLSLSLSYSTLHFPIYPLIVFSWPYKKKRSMPASEK